jgi:hypothetical protein
MQFHHPPALIAASSTDKLLNNAVTGPSLFLILIAIAIGASVIGNFLASVMLAKHNATLGRAVLTLVAEILYGFGCAIAAVVVAVLLGAAKVGADILVVAIFVVPVLFIIVWVMIPMHVYDIGILRSIAFILLSGLIGGIVHGGAQVALVGHVDYNRLATKFERFLAERNIRQPAKDAQEPEINQRRAALVQRFEQLEIRRRYLPPTDRKALADYERDKTAYERDLEEFKADAGE